MYTVTCRLSSSFALSCVCEKMQRLFLLLSLASVKVIADPPTPHDLVGQVFIYGQVNQTAFIKVSWKADEEGSDLQFNVFHKHVSDFGFRQMSVGRNRTFTLQNVLFGEEYEVRVSSVEVRTGEKSPLSRGLTVGVHYLQKVVTVATPGAVSVTCKFAHTTQPTGCSVSLTAESDRKDGNAFASKKGVTIPQATVRFTELQVQEYTYSATAYLLVDGQWLQQNRSISGTVTPLEQVSETPEGSFYSQNFDLVTIIFLVTGVVLLPVVLLILVAIAYEGGKRCTRKKPGGLYINTVEKLAYVTEKPKSRCQVLVVDKEDQQRPDPTSHIEMHADSESLKEVDGSFPDLPPASHNSMLECYSTHAHHGSAFERRYSHSSSVSSFGKALSLTDIQPRRNSLDRKRRLSFKGSFPFVAVRRESIDEEPLPKAYSCDTGLNAGNGSRPLGKRQSVSKGGSEDTISLRTSLFDILDAFESQIISVPGSSGTVLSTDRESSSFV